MPIPTPTPMQSKDAFIAECMGDTTMNEDYPDSPQRYAVCLGAWDSARGVQTKQTTTMGWPVSPF